MSHVESWTITSYSIPPYNHYYHGGRMDSSMLQWYCRHLSQDSEISFGNGFQTVLFVTLLCFVSEIVLNILLCKTYIILAARKLYFVLNAIFNNSLEIRELLYGDGPNWRSLPTDSIFQIVTYWAFTITFISSFDVTRRFGNWICFRPQVKGGAVEEDTYSVGPLRKS
jgi:hypothetical protein